MGGGSAGAQQLRFQLQNAVRVTDTGKPRIRHSQGVNSRNAQVPGMFAADERDAIMSDLREWVVAQGLPAGREGVWGAFIDRVRDNLHIVLAMSPVGDAFRAR